MKNIKDYYVEYGICRGFHEPDERALLGELAKLKSGDNYVEIGVADGSSILIAATARPDIQCYGIEKSAECKADKLITDVGVKNITLFLGQGAEERCKTWDKEIDFLFIDGYHCWPNVFWDFAGWYPYVKQGGTILFHDYGDKIYDIGTACQVFSNHPKYNLVRLGDRMARIIKV